MQFSVFMQKQHRVRLFEFDVLNECKEKCRGVPLSKVNNPFSVWWLFISALECNQHEIVTSHSFRE